MELRHLRCFVAVAEERHFRRAAERLRLSQPPLSKQIRALEEYLGALLLHRTRREVRLTPAGQAFLARAKDILERVERAPEAIRMANDGSVGKLEIGYTVGLEIGVVPPVLRRFRKRFPDVEIRLHPLSTREQLSELKARRIDIGFTVFPARSPGVKVLPIGTQPLVFAAPLGHPLAKCPEAPVTQLQDEPLVLLARAEAPIYHDLVISVARQAGVTPKVVAEPRNLHDNLFLVSAGMGLSLLPASVRQIPWKGVCFCPLENGVPGLKMGVAVRDEEDGAALSNMVEIERELYTA
jgi:DNA-binding transcriptional LysR family regulator